MERSSGILMHISSLPNRFGIGSMGAEAYAFVDFLARAGQRWWQLLPLGPTGYGDSPYQPFSSWAGNPYFIDIDLLINDGLLSEEEAAPSLCPEGGPVDYGRLYAERFALLRKAYSRGRVRDIEAFGAFRGENAQWLDDYALFMALKSRFSMKPWYDWPEAAMMREPEAMAGFKEELAGETEFYSYLQFLFFSQWDKLKAYAAEKGIGIIGDMPIYVAMDSADVWAQPGVFQLDENRRPGFVSGVPPDYFSADGQLWGNPLYDYEAMERDGFKWWLSRIGMAARLYDMLRIDHFRGLESYWRVSAQAQTAREGEWVKGPGMKLIDAINANYPGLEIIAEDLGLLTDGVRELLRASGYPGMKVLQFAFDAHEPSNYLPHTYPRKCCCYTGTHDNTTICGWFSEVDSANAALAVKYLGLSDDEGCGWGMIRGGMSSVADLFVAGMQDYLMLPASARMNTPGTVGKNWCWRMDKSACTDALADKIAYYTRIYSRS